MSPRLEAQYVSVCSMFKKAQLRVGLSFVIEVFLSEKLMVETGSSVLFAFSVSARAKKWAHCRSFKDLCPEL